MCILQLTRTGKSQYSETEAAEELGISVVQLRTMIRSHVVEHDEDLNNVPVTHLPTVGFADPQASFRQATSRLKRSAIESIFYGTTWFSWTRHHGLSHGPASAEGGPRSRVVVEHRGEGPRTGEGRQRDRVRHAERSGRASPTSFSTASAIPPWRATSRSVRTGFIEGVRKGSIIADCSTISPAVSKEIGEAVRRQGRALPGRPLHRIEARRGEGHADLHGRRRQGGVRTCQAVLRDHGQAVLLLRRGRAGPAGQADAEPGAGRTSCKPSPKEWCWRPKAASPPS